MDGEEENSFNELPDDEDEGEELTQAAPTGQPMSEEEADALREAEIQRILALADMIDANGEASQDDLAAAAQAMTASTGVEGGGGEAAKCPFDHSGAVSAAPPVPAAQPAAQPQRGSELQRLVESEAGSQSVEEMLRLAEEVDKWMGQQ